jgi:hypothetical protein
MARKMGDVSPSIELEPIHIAHQPDSITVTSDSRLAGSNSIASKSILHELIFKGGSPSATPLCTLAATSPPTRSKRRSKVSTKVSSSVGAATKSSVTIVRTRIREGFSQQQTAHKTRGPSERGASSSTYTSRSPGRSVTTRIRLRADSRQTCD